MSAGMLSQDVHVESARDRKRLTSPVSYAYDSIATQYPTNAFAPSGVSFFAASGITGTGTFRALLVAVAGL